MHFDLGHFKGYISKLKQLLVVQHVITIPCYSYVHELFYQTIFTVIQVYGDAACLILFKAFRINLCCHILIML